MKSADVVILGAGMAGLRAAQVIRESKPDCQVMILEARHVVGGRIRWTHTPSSSSLLSDKVEDNNLYMDEGAQFIHGVAAEHPICQLAEKHGLHYRKIEFGKRHLLVGPHAEKLPPEQRGKINRAVGKIFAHLREWSQDKSKPDTSLKSLVDPFIEKLCQEDPLLSSQHLYVVFRRRMVNDLGEDLADISAHFYDQDKDFSDTHAVPQYYQNFVKALPVQDSVYFRHVVEQVLVHEESIEICCRHADTNQKIEIDTPRVICTLPLGVLKRKAHDMFHPSLPQYLQDSINRLGYSCLEKVWLKFSCPPFWPTDADAFSNIASDTPFGSWFLPARVYDNPAYDRMLCCWVSGSAGRAMAASSPRQVGQQALAALSEILSVPVQQDILEHVHVTRWSTDPWSGHGSYSSMVVGSTPDDYRAFEGSFYGNRLWFAGEATCAEYQSTVHGAYLSGERAARKCLETMA